MEYHTEKMKAALFRAKIEEHNYMDKTSKYISSS